MRPELMSTQHALRFIETCVSNGRAILTVDGFRVVPEGYMEDIDLLFAPDERLSSSEAAVAGQQFIRDNAEQEIVWEVWAR